MADSPTNHKPVLVVGGTGAVGRHLVTLLTSEGRNVIVGSRSLPTATEASNQFEHASPIAIDTSDTSLTLPSGIGLVIDCTGTAQTNVARAAIAAGADLIDISASTNHLDELTALASAFVEAKRRCMIGVGLAPGLSTMLASAVHNPDSPKPMSIHGILDTRDEHGPGSAAFTLGKIGTDFTDPTTGLAVRNFTGLQRPNLPAGFGKRIVARADFPDQHTLTNDLGVPVTTNYGFTSTITTLAITTATRLPAAGKILDRIARHTPRPTGTGPWLITAQTDSAAAWATGTGQAKGTAVLTHLTASHLTKRHLGPGVHQLHQSMTLDPETLAELAHHGIAIAMQNIGED